MSTVWKIHAEDDFGRARIVLTGDGHPVGVVTIPMGEYVLIWRSLMRHLINTTKSTIAEKLTERLYKDALLAFDDSPELAQQKLLEFGWNPEKIERYADELAREVAGKLAESLPGSGP